MIDYIIENPNFAGLLPFFHLLNTCGLNGFEPWPQLSNPEPDLRFGSAIFENPELNFRFGSGRFRFEPKFRTELVHHYILSKSQFYEP